MTLLRHSSESWNLTILKKCFHQCKKVKWIPAFAGMTMLWCSQAAAQSTATPNANITNQLQNLLNNKKNADALGQAMAVGTILDCTQKQAGKEATQQFYQEMNTVGKTVSAYCKEGHATEARALVLTTLERNQSNQVYQAALGCYDSQAANISNLAGPKIAPQIAQYATWARDVPAAQQNMKESDICKPKAIQ